MREVNVLKDRHGEPPRRHRQTILLKILNRAPVYGMPFIYFFIDSAFSLCYIAAPLKNTHPVRKQRKTLYIIKTNMRRG